MWYPRASVVATMATKMLGTDMFLGQYCLPIQAVLQIIIGMLNYLVV